MTSAHTATIELLNKIQRGKNKSKIKHDTLYNDDQNGGLKKNRYILKNS